MNERAAPAGVSAILLDIEGTTTPIAFVYDVLFPYARAHLRRHLTKSASSPRYERLFDQLREEHASDRRAGEDVPPWSETPALSRAAAAADYCEWLMDRDRKSTPLKALQGRVWVGGYRKGELRGEVFADVPVALERWHAQHRKVGIFSSGSVLAQHLLFRHATAGDLSRFIDCHFDTTIGSKGESESYRRIAGAMAMPAAHIMFVSDVTRELDGARFAGMQTRLSIRPGNPPPPPDHGHTAIRSFDDLE